MVIPESSIVKTLKIGVFILLGSFIISCNIQETVKQFDHIDKFNKDLVKYFEHEEIHTMIGTGTSPGDNRLEITFYSYDVVDTKYAQMRSISEQVCERIHTNHEYFKNKNYIIVKFTEHSTSENPDEFLYFRCQNLILE